LSLDNELSFLSHYLGSNDWTKEDVDVINATSADWFQSSMPSRTMVWMKKVVGSGLHPSFDRLKKVLPESDFEILHRAVEGSNRVVDIAALSKNLRDEARRRLFVSRLQQRAADLDSGVVDLVDASSGLDELLPVGVEQDDWEESDFFDVLERAKAGQALEELSAQQNLLVTGIDGFDEVIASGAGTYGALCAMPGLGKTSLMFQWAALSAKAGIKTYAMSLETKKSLLEAKSVAALVASENGKAFVSTVLRKGCTSISNYHTNKIQPGVLKIGFHPAGLPWVKLESRIRSMAAQGYKLFMFDYFGLLEPPQVRGKQDWAMYGEMSKAIKMLAEVLGICIIAVVQPNGEVDYGEKPSPKNLGTTKQVFRDYDFGVYLWSDKAADISYKAIPGNEHARLLRGWLHKNRQFAGSEELMPEPEVWIRWEPSLNYFREDRDWRSTSTPENTTSSRMRTK
jgi:hypothetical protein